MDLETYFRWLLAFWLIVNAISSLVADHKGISFIEALAKVLAKIYLFMIYTLIFMLGSTVFIGICKSFYIFLACLF